MPPNWLYVQTGELPSPVSSTTYGITDDTVNGVKIQIEPVSAGGTGQSVMPINAVLLGNGSSAITFAAPSSSGGVFQSNGSGSAPSFSNSITLPTGGTFTGDGLTIRTGGLTVTAGGLTVTAGGLTVTAGGLTFTAGGLTVTAGGLTVTAGGISATASSFNLGGSAVNNNSFVQTITGSSTNNNSYGLQINAGTTGADIPLYVRNQANNTTLFEVFGTGAATIGGTLLSGGITITNANSPDLTFQQAGTRIQPGSTSLSLRNHANNADNLLITDAGAVTIRNGLTVTAGGLTFGDTNTNITATTRPMSPSTTSAMSPSLAR